LPIDPISPPGRIKYTLKDSAARVLLTAKQPAGEIEFNGKTIEITAPGAYRQSEENLEATNSPGDPAYIIYTSGTTGKPKGVQLQHRNLVNYVSWFKKEAQLTASDKTPLTSSYAFDLGYTSIFPSVLSGAQLHMLTKETYLSDRELLDYIEKNGITYIKMTPSLFTIIANSPDISKEKCKNLRLVVLGGEAINLRDVARAHRICKHIRFMNHYGPTEATIGTIATYIDFENYRQYEKNPVIGKPIHNSGVYILDKYRGLLPPGTAGELTITGDGLAAGYLNREDLTAEKFIPNPYIPGERIYRTGDLARILPDGNVQFLGRIDHQVKVRGYRIELGEIENQLLAVETIREAIVIDRQDNDGTRYLAAYFTASEKTAPEKIKEKLAQTLP
ncbi:MAG: amino acid adenylation domain-containing protein, partial [bacterium]|nr:amino acid adenylation domain-containing protein [bacterium]